LTNFTNRWIYIILFYLFVIFNTLSKLKNESGIFEKVYTVLEKVVVCLPDKTAYHQVQAFQLKKKKNTAAIRKNM